MNVGIGVQPIIAHYDLALVGDMIEAMRSKAGQVGANAVILDAISEPSAGAKLAGAIFHKRVNRKGSAVAIFIHEKK